MRKYYAQRATRGGLLIAEASPVMATGFGSPGVPGIYTEQQIAGWRKVVNAVHAKGGVIFLQLWNVGRVSNPDLPRRLQRGFPLTPYDRRPSAAAMSPAAPTIPVMMSWSRPDAPRNAKREDRPCFRKRKKSQRKNQNR
jgi:2,4-dienoyl-CoA reductase-like NADH-dependent reductase (Old Yellow Enzyme family)